MTGGIIVAAAAILFVAWRELLHVMQQKETDERWMKFVNTIIDKKNAPDFYSYYNAQGLMGSIEKGETTLTPTQINQKLEEREEEESSVPAFMNQR